MGEKKRGRQVGKRRERERGKRRKIYSFIGYILPHWRSNLPTLVYRDDAPINWAIKPGQFFASFSFLFAFSFWGKISPAPTFLLSLCTKYLRYLSYVSKHKFNSGHTLQIQGLSYNFNVVHLWWSHPVQLVDRGGIFLVWLNHQWMTINERKSMGIRRRVGLILPWDIMKCCQEKPIIAKESQVSIAFHDKGRWVL